MKVQFYVVYDLARRTLVTEEDDDDDGVSLNCCFGLAMMELRKE